MSVWLIILIILGAVLVIGLAIGLSIWCLTSEADAHVDFILQQAEQKRKEKEEERQRADEAMKKMAAEIEERLRKELGYPQQIASSSEANANAAGESTLGKDVIDAEAKEVD